MLSVLKKIDKYARLTDIKTATYNEIIDGKGVIIGSN